LNSDRVSVSSSARFRTPLASQSGNRERNRDSQRRSFRRRWTFPLSLLRCIAQPPVVRDRDWYKAPPWTRVAATRGLAIGPDARFTTRGVPIASAYAWARMAQSNGTHMGPRIGRPAAHVAANSCMRSRRKPDRCPCWDACSPNLMANAPLPTTSGPAHALQRPSPFSRRRNRSAPPALVRTRPVAEP
jgi:hypothetical protein